MNNNFVSDFSKVTGVPVSIIESKADAVESDYNQIMKNDGDVIYDYYSAIGRSDCKYNGFCASVGIIGVEGAVKKDIMNRLAQYYFNYVPQIEFSSYEGTEYKNAVEFVYYSLLFPLETIYNLYQCESSAKR
jgi:hypothetical protein